MLSALSQEMRLRMIRYLIGRGGDGAAAGEISEAMGAISSKTSFHLTVLERAGLISSERRSRQIIYRARLDNLGGLVSFMLEDCCANHPDIMACCAPMRDGCKTVRHDTP
ncbi:MAG: metalloregulator ArsR/SmtB family transcription factor [Pseudomonadota bacterium]